MRAPAFWWRPQPSPVAQLLAPIGAVYGTVTARRMRRPGVHIGAPVVCVGNLVAGGAGKTPTAMSLASLLRGEGFSPAFVSRGYGRTGPTARGAVLRVDPQRHTADEVGDEPLLLATVAPTFVSADRAAAGRRAVADGADLVILDDGLQNPSLRKAFSLAVIDGNLGFGNECCVPAGPLRAPLDAQWPHVSAACIIGPGDPGRRAAALADVRGLPCWTAALVPDPAALDRLRGKRLYAFAGIGHPPKFFATLRAQGLDVVETKAFADHHLYKGADVEALEQAARRFGAQLVTTEKDRVRLPPELPVATLPVSLVFDDPSAVVAALVEAIRRGSAP